MGPGRAVEATAAGRAGDQAELDEIRLDHLLDRVARLGQTRRQRLDPHAMGLAQLGGVRGFDAAPWYVVGKDIDSNVLVVDQGSDSPFLLSSMCWTETAHWIAGAPPAARFTCHAQTRYRQPEEPCDVVVAADGTLEVRFAHPQRAATPGQSLVLYDGDTCLGGAVIATTDAPLALHQHHMTRSSAA